MQQIKIRKVASATKNSQIETKIRIKWAIKPTIVNIVKLFFKLVHLFTTKERRQSDNF